MIYFVQLLSVDFIFFSAVDLLTASNSFISILLSLFASSSKIFLIEILSFLL